MHVLVVDTGNVSTVAAEVEAFGRDLANEWRCAALPGVPDEATIPTAALLEAFVERHGTLALVALEGARVVGYTLADGGGRVRWTGAHPDYPEAFGQMFMIVKAWGGKVYGRVRNELVRQTIMNACPWTGVLDPRDPEMIGDL